ncbi:hypothetical protein DSO57_1023352 [Entomophthora muscae]|uniref:Uncharacterized protein n=1 Tax=Entomophthora muscae TaxID=34485 RepID=A0ACC2RHM9_9FUNG|nr:hypothetical protein DSO57_1023352 [Entomophthora muscae]
MITAVHIVGLASVYIAYKLYVALKVPPGLEDVPAIPLAASLKSLVNGTSFDSHFEKLIHPALSENSMARLWKQGHWELVIGNAQLAKEIYNNTAEFPKLNQSDVRLGRTLGRRTLGYTNILLSDGDEWRRHRRIANPAFKKTWSTAMFGDCADKLISLLNKSEGTPVQIQDLFQRLTLDVLGNGLLSYDFEAIAKGNENYYLRLYHDVIGEVFNPIYVTFPSLETLVPWRRISHQKSKEFRQFLRGIIRGRKEELYEKP